MGVAVRFPMGARRGASNEGAPVGAPRGRGAPRGQGAPVGGPPRGIGAPSNEVREEAVEV